MNPHRPVEDRTALVLTGGGARAAYQVGVLKAAAELLPKRAHNPFSIITGTSAGAINAVALGASANNFRLAVKKVERIWSQLHVGQVYKASSKHLIGGILRLAVSLFHQGSGRRRPISILNNEPLAQLLARAIDFGDLERRLQGGLLDAIGITASSYATGESITFYQSDLDGDTLPPWRKARRRGVPAKLTIEHLLASSAIPTIMPAARIGDTYYGDGALRQVSPISPAIHLGAERVMIVGVSNNPNRQRPKTSEPRSPSMARIMGHLFNSAFIDSLENDVETMARINELVGIIANENPRSASAGLRHIDFLCINPTIEINELVAKHIKALPRAMRSILKMTGATPSGGGTSMASYLLFEGAFCEELIACGYRDAMTQKDDLMDFFYPRKEIPL